MTYFVPKVNSFFGFFSYFPADIAEIRGRENRRGGRQRWRECRRPQEKPPCNRTNGTYKTYGTYAAGNRALMRWEYAVCKRRSADSDHAYPIGHISPICPISPIGGHLCSVDLRVLRAAPPTAARRREDGRVLRCPPNPARKKSAAARFQFAPGRSILNEFAGRCFSSRAAIFIQSLNTRAGGPACTADR